MSSSSSSSSQARTKRETSSPNRLRSVLLLASLFRVFFFFLFFFFLLSTRRGALGVLACKRVVKEIKGFPFFFFFFYGSIWKRSGFFLLFSLVFWLSRGDVVVSLGGERIFFFFPTHNRWKKIMDDEREELAEKEYS